MASKPYRKKDALFIGIVDSLVMHMRGEPLSVSLSPALESLCDLIDRALGFHGIIIYEDERGILFLGDQGWVDNEGCPYLHAQKFNLELS